MSASQVKISVIIPVYNVENYLSTCLSSCVAQTLNNVEFICVDDGSTDRSLSLINEFASCDSRIRVIAKSNGGVSSARNAGLQQAQGRYIMFLDADDYLEPTACERVWTETLEAPTDIVIFGAWIFPHVHPRPTPWYYSVLSCPTRRYDNFSAKLMFKEPSVKPFIWHQAFRKELLDENGIMFRDDVRHGEDMVFLLQTYPHAKHFVFLQDQLYHYRWYREGSLMYNFQGDMDKRIETHLSFIRIICDYWKSQGWLDAYGKDFLEWLLVFVVRDIRDENTQRPQEHCYTFAKLMDEFDLWKYVRKVSVDYYKDILFVKKCMLQRRFDKR